MKLLDDKIRELHDTYWRDQQEAAQGKVVVLVEGDDDRDVLDRILRRRAPTWDVRIRIVSAGGRSRVLKRMTGTFPETYGLVDRELC